MGSNWCLLLIFLICLGCTKPLIEPVQTNEPSGVDNVAIEHFEISSPAFKNNEKIPAKYSCQGEDINPELRIRGIPKNTTALALIMDDPDAPIGVWDHWILWNIGPTDKIKENSVPEGAVQGLNSWSRRDYGGPCPPSGTHRYFFKLYALDTMLNLKSGDKQALLDAMEGHIIAKAELIGLYEKG